uniref:Iron transporter n=1 Tax=Paulinella micropora TaxID=1928728 RepID=A0A1L5YBE6_9EUKA|nr:iron transporter [Paulinella micropora]AQX44795.1 iron transporter [Paulinella micropora]
MSCNLLQIPFNRLLVMESSTGSHLKLSELEPGQEAIITALFTQDQYLLRRLNALGFCQGKQLKLLRRGPWGSPLHLRIGMTELMMRERDASQIIVEPCIGVL